MGASSDRVTRATVARAEGSLVRFNAVTLITAGRTRALAVGGALKSLGGTLLTLGRSVIPTVITAMRGLNLAFMASPIGLILTGIAVGAALIIANWSKIKSALAPILEWLGEKLAWIGEVAKGIGKAVGWVAGKLGLGKEKVPKIGETAGAATEPSQALPYTEPSMVEYSGSAEAGEVSVVINQTVNLDSGTPPDALRRALTEGRERIREVVEEIMESYMVRRRRLGSA